jgi:hypothetical protein
MSGRDKAQGEKPDEAGNPASGRANTRRVDRVAIPEPLYGSEEQIAAAVLGPGHLREWRERAVILERDGLPVIDALMGGRYLPAVRKFFDRRNGVLDGIAAVPQKADGKEHFPCPKKAKPKPPASTGGPAKAENVFHIGELPAKQ